MRAAFGRGVEHAENAVERAAEVFAVGAGVFGEIILKLVFDKNQGVVGKKAEQQADNELFEVVFGVIAVSAEGGIKVAHCGGGFDVGLLFGGFEGLADAVHKIEVFQLNLLGQIFQRKGQTGVFLQIVKFDAGKIAHDDMAWYVLRIVAADFFHIFQCLPIGGLKVFACGFVLAQ